MSGNFVEASGAVLFVQDLLRGRKILVVGLEAV